MHYILFLATIISVVESSTLYIDEGSEYLQLIKDKYGNYCGYNHNNKGSSPVDRFDHCCAEHDECVARCGYDDIDCHFDLLNCAKEAIKSPNMANYTFLNKIIKTVSNTEKCIPIFRKNYELTYLVGNTIYSVANSAPPILGIICDIIRFSVIITGNTELDICIKFARDVVGF